MALSLAASLSKGSKEDKASWTAFPLQLVASKRYLQRPVLEATVFIASSPNDSAVYAEHTGDGIGIFGRGGWNSGEGLFGETATPSSGVYGKNAADGNGISGESFEGIGVSGISSGGVAGVYGRSDLGGGVGVQGENNHGIGVQGQADNELGIGVYGTSRYGLGVEGYSAHAIGVYGSSDLGAGVSGFGPIGVIGEAFNGVGVAGGSKKVGVHAYNYHPRQNDGFTGPEGIVGHHRNDVYLGAQFVAGDFFGDVFVSGHLSKASGSFVIDHPLNPSNKFLSHSLVESSEMKNLYDGVSILDEAGGATVEMPAWFDATNRGFRYQLTIVGAPSPNLHVADELDAGTFKIAGGTPDSRVSWQVTASRKDPWAIAHPLEVEKEKAPGERGYYLHPELYHAPNTRAMQYARYPTEDRHNHVDSPSLTRPARRPVTSSTKKRLANA